MGLLTNSPSGLCWIVQGGKPGKGGKGAGFDKKCMYPVENSCGKLIYSSLE